MRSCRMHTMLADGASRGCRSVSFEAAFSLANGAGMIRLTLRKPGLAPGGLGEEASDADLLGGVSGCLGVGR